MIPLSLSIQGLYSYKEKQTVDFRMLTDSRLFGIFGKVGSGKSSILEAIMFVLYDNSGRLNKANDNRYYNMLNLQSDEMLIDFEFLAGEANSQTYRFVFRAKRKRSDFQKVEVKERSYYQQVDGEWSPLENVKDATEIIGMNYDNFRQTIIIPQGKFREFIDQTSTQRTKMLQEIFQLDQFDLSAKTGSLLKEAEGEIRELEGRLSETGEVDEILIKALEDELKQLLESLQKEAGELKVSREQEGKMAELKKLFVQVSEAREQVQQLKQKAGTFQQKEAQLATYEKAYTYFREILQAQKEEHVALDAKKGLIKALKQKQELQQEVFVKATAEYEKAQEGLEQKDKISAAVEDLKSLLTVNTLTVEMLTLDTSLEQLKNQCEQEGDKLKQLAEQIKKTEAEIEKEEQEAPDLGGLHAVDAWHVRRNSLLKEQQEASRLLSDYQKQQEALAKRQQELITQSGHEAFHQFASVEQFFELAKAQKEKLEAEGELTGKQVEALKVKQEISNFAAKLVEGEPCQLCGSVHHPQPAEGAEVKAEIEALEEKRDKMRREYRLMNELEQQVNRIQADVQSKKELALNQREKVSEAGALVEAHQSAFEWPQYQKASHENIQAQLKQVKQFQQKLKEKKGSLSQNRQQWEQQEQALKAKQEKLQTDEKQVLVLQTRIAEAKHKLKVLPYEKYQDWSAEQLQAKLRDGERKLNLLVEHFEKADKELKSVEQERSRLEGQLSAELQNLERIELKVAQLQEEITTRCQQQQFESVESVQRLLALQLDVQSERAQIDAYKQQVHTAGQELNKLEKEAEGKQYEQEKHQQLLEEITRREELLKGKEQEAAVKKREIAEWQQKLKHVRELMKKLDHWQQRKGNLQELAQLFRGNGFVNYVSSIYLQNLCEAANQRFKKLTRNNLSLELNESNEFIVRDHLNNGRTRLLKTLSGGQTFQAALCLALSLAEHVKALNKAEQSFFFLDEGFGALDKDSLRVVFDTLKSLRKENRIAGIISHVEELQQEIDVYLHVENDKEKGSIVRGNWQ